MTRSVRFTRAAQEDLERLFTFLAEQDVLAARRAFEKIDKAWEFVREFPFACRKAAPDDPFVRELLINFGGSGYVALYEIEGEEVVTVLAVRHAREDDYH
jgi:plasmid stabilization system protein ParE